MKSKKIIAMIVAFAAFMAVATSGLAAATVTTLTTYDVANEKVIVDVDVSGASNGSEVTYLVTNSDGNIVYIDQKTASTTGAVEFDYKIAKADIPNLVTKVKFGTNGVEKITDTEPLNLVNANIAYDTNQAIVGLYADEECTKEINVLGTENKTYLSVEAKEGYEVVKVTVDGEEVTSNSTVYEIEGNGAIVVETKAAEQSVTSTNEDVSSTVISNDENAEDVVGKEVNVTLFKVTAGTPTKVGVKIGDVEYPALTTVGDVNDTDPIYTSNGIYAVRIISDEAVVVVPYCE